MSLNWSISRDSTLDACERRYYYQYVVTARANSRDSTLREVARLKHLQSMAMWQGDVFHRAAADIVRSLRDGRALDVSAVHARVRNTIEGQWDFSAAAGYLSDAKAVSEGRGVALFEHEYDIVLPPDAREAAVARVSSWIGRFIAWTRDNDFGDDLRRAAQTWIEPQAFGPFAPGFRRHGVQVLTKVDLAVRRKDGTFVIYDWKTGAVPLATTIATSDAEYQVTVYQLWPHLALHVPLSAITARLIYLGSEPIMERVFTIDENTRARAIRRVDRAIKRANYFDGGGGAPSLMADDFDLAGHVGICRWCCFKRVCQGAVEVASGAADADEAGRDVIELELDLDGAGLLSTSAPLTVGDLSSVGLSA